jgi:hypothetical protein
LNRLIVLAGSGSKAYRGIPKLYREVRGGVFLI